MAHDNISVLYHADCPDGFGGAYAAWKKFGDTAEYIPVKYGRTPPVVEKGREIYFVDFCYPKNIMDAFAKDAKRLVVLDHHLGTRSVVESMPEHIFDEKRSGAVIAWNYFHPDIPTPLILRYVQAGDLYIFDMPESRAALSYLYTHSFHFSEWDHLATVFENETERRKIFERGTIYYEYYSLIVSQMAARAELVEFEGYECYLASSPSQFISDVGHELSKKKGPIALVAGGGRYGGKILFPGGGALDVSELARRHGGNGHQNASAFFILWSEPLPWKSLSSHDSTG